MNCSGKLHLQTKTSERSSIPYNHTFSKASLQSGLVSLLYLLRRRLAFLVINQSSKGCLLKIIHGTV